LLTVLGVVFGPGVYQAWKFRQTCNALLGDVRAGNLKAVPGYVLPKQQMLMRLVVSNPIADNYVEDIKSLKLSNYSREENHVWAIVTSRIEGGIGQGKLRWEWDGKEWKLDALGSYVRAGVTDEFPWRGLPGIAGGGSKPGEDEGGLEGLLP
jgi:hypothetical protein